jgi:hypothetical protein
MPLPVKSKSSPSSFPIDPLALGGLGAIGLFAGLIGGVAWAGLGVAAGTLFVVGMRRQAVQIEQARIHQENLQFALLQQARPEDIAKLRSLSEVKDESLFEFLEALKKTYSGESVRGSGRLPSEEQTEAVAPGITLTLAHDLGWWYAKLHLAGETGRQFLHGEYTQWKGRGRTPEEAVDAVIKRCGASRQQKLIQEYAARLVDGE